MKVVVERSSNRGTSYAINDDGARSVVCTSCEIVLVEDRPVAVFYDSDMKVLKEPSAFMLREMEYDSDNTRDQAISALKLLCSYSAIIGAPIVSFGSEEARGFVRFARGTMGDSVAYSFRGLGRRSEATINSYLRVIRHYVRHLGVPNSPFLDRETKRRCGEDGRIVDFEGYAVSARVPESLMAPPYVSRPEYRALKAAIGEDSSLLNPAMLIVRLEFEHGLRVGEVLGLTLEDLQLEPNQAGGYSYFLVLRDRVCDRPDQHAKSLSFKPRVREDYGSGGYRKRGAGYQKVYIPESLYFAIDEYVEVTRAHFSEEQLSASAADSVGGEWSMEGNQYLFLNTMGRTLTSKVWNKRLRSYFLRAGLHVDEGCRKTNLNHRLRHGFAMMLKKDLKVDDVTAKLLMRHRSVRSIQPYLLPTEEDVHFMYTTVISGIEGLLLGGGEAA